MPCSRGVLDDVHYEMPIIDGSTPAIPHRLAWDSRCADCRTLLPARSAGYRVDGRLLCEECSFDAEWMEAAL